MPVKPFWFPSGDRGQPTQPPKPQPWPKWATAIAIARKPEDAGVGDTIARIVGPIGGNAYKVWFKATFGKSCGCTERQAEFNHRFPY